MSTIINQNTPYSLEALVTDDKGKGIENLIINYTITKAFEDTLIFSSLMTSIGKGVYKDTINLSEIGQYRVLYNLENYYIDAIETLIVQGISNEINTLLTNSKLLLEEVSKIYNTLYPTIPFNKYTTKYTTLIKKDEESFATAYNKAVSLGWVLIKIEGNNFYFEKL